MRLPFPSLPLVAYLWVGRATCQTTLSAQPLLASSTSSQPCPTKLSSPIAIPIRNVTAAGRVLRRDVSMSIGTPPQLLAFDVSFERDEIYVNDGQASCATNDTADQCMVRFGGLFNGADSSTYHFYSGLTAPGLPQSSSSDKTPGDTFTDAILLTHGLGLSQFPIRINRAFHYLVSTYNYVGLAPTSIIMESLVTSNQVSSNSIGYSSGWNGADITHDVDGSLVLGGYDRAKTAGPNATLSIARAADCQNGFKLRLTDMSLNLSNGRNISLMNSSDVLHTACIDTVSDSIRLTPSLWSSFLRSSGSTETGRVEDGFNREGFLIAADTAYGGDMTLRVEPDIEIRIPNHQLVMPVYGADASGHLYINDTENKKIRLWTDTNPPGPPEQETMALGRSFMSSTYLLVDYDRGNFTIWPSRAMNETDLVPIGPSSCDEPTAATSSESATSSEPVTSSEPATSSDNKTQHNMSKGTLAGSIVGACAGLALLIAIPCLIIRRHKKRKRQESNVELGAEENLNWWRRWQQAQGPFWWQSKAELPDDPQSKPPEVAGDTYHEMSSANQSHVQPRMHEMPGDSIQQELPAAEISTELPLTRRPSAIGLAGSQS